MNSLPLFALTAAAPITPLALTTLWIYVTLLMVGGLMGFLKAVSRVSLITSAIFAVLLALCATGIIKPFYITDILLGLLVIVFWVRLQKTRKFMPSGMILVLTLVALGVMLVARR